MQNYNLLSKQSTNKSIHITEDDMIHIIWKHVTIRINVTGLIYLVDFLDGDFKREAVGFKAYGTLDDGFQIWIQDIGLRLSSTESVEFKKLLTDGLEMLRIMGKKGRANHLPDCFKLTVDHQIDCQFSNN